LREQRALGGEIGVDVGAAKAIDGLLRIADYEQATRPQLPFDPRLIGRAFAAEPPQDLCLEGIGVLELVDQDSRIAPAEIPAYGLVTGKEVTGVIEQVVEIQQCCLALVIGIKPGERNSAMRPAISAVLPLPAPASTRSVVS
jgi:hypothetical protein